MPKYRVKTRSEMEKEFGAYWRQHFESGFPYGMDNLLGQVIEAPKITKKHPQKMCNGCWTIELDMVKPFEEQVTRRISTALNIMRNGRMTIATLIYQGKKYEGIAKCSPVDEFDQDIGVALALQRLSHKITEYSETIIKNKLDEI